MKDPITEDPNKDSTTKDSKGDPTTEDPKKALKLFLFFQPFILYRNLSFS